MSAATSPAPGPRFTLVSAAYNVAPYLAEFIESVEGQTFPLDQVEVIMVDDGSTDESLAMLQDWQRRRPELVRVISKPNGGVSSARNAGLEHVTGEWVGFPDPDDILDPKYLSEVDKFLRRRPTAMMIATSRVLFNDATRVESKHPLHRHFVPGMNRLRNLDYDTGHFHGSAPAAFFRTEVLNSLQLRFDERIATFEDGHFCSLYLLLAPEPLIGFVSSAIYNYRKRNAGTSALDRSWTDPRRFVASPEYGYLHLLRTAAERKGRAPSWVQAMVIYELSWYFRVNERFSAEIDCDPTTLARFHALLDQICELLDDIGVDSYAATWLNPMWREMLLHGTKREIWHTAFAVVDKLDPAQKLMRVCYRFTGELPAETFVVYGNQVAPVHQKIRDVRFFDRTMLHERIVWLPFGTLRVVLDGRDLDVRTSEPDRVNHRLNGVRIQRDLNPAVPEPEQPARRKLSPADRLVLRLAATPAVRRRFQDAWVLIDRIFNADDSAEHLFRYLRTNRPNVNAWFVIERGTPDERRLRRDGYGSRIVPHGTLRWKLLMLNCQHLISSHADDVILRPRAITRLAEPRWRIAFLQHGVTKDDLSTWLNRKNLDLFVTSTPAEQESVVADHTAYRYTTREAKLTGLPRFDRILEAGGRFPPERRDLILIAPTWRQWLTTADPELGRHTVQAERFQSSDFARAWTAFANSPELAELAERAGLTVAVLLHPNFQATARLETAPHVRQLTFDGEDVQELFARARVLVTDYSSMFFNAAYIDRPVVYFQFDRDRVLGGWHVGRRGYFDYERDGFGAVAVEVDQAVSATVKAVENGPDPEPLYLDRIKAAFPDRDGRCCERVADAIAASAPAPLVVRRARPRLKARVRRVAGRVANRSPHLRRALNFVRATRDRTPKPVR